MRGCCATCESGMIGCEQSHFTLTEFGSLRITSHSQTLVILHLFLGVVAEGLLRECHTTREISLVVDHVLVPLPNDVSLHSQGNRKT